MEGIMIDKNHSGFDHSVFDGIDRFTETIALCSLNFPDRVVRHKNFLGELDPFESISDRSDATFQPFIPGLAFENGFQGAVPVSWESVKLQNFFLRHQDFKLKLQAYDSSEQFKLDATFFIVPALGDNSGRFNSFQACNFSTRYLRHRDFHLFIEEITNDGDRQDATFQIGPGFVGVTATSRSRIIE
jgi:hypothetical protein